MTPDDVGASSLSNSSSCAPVLCLAKTLKLAPPGTSVAPNGKLLPFKQAMEGPSSIPENRIGPHSTARGDPVRVLCSSTGERRVSWFFRNSFLPLLLAP